MKAVTLAMLVSTCIASQYALAVDENSPHNHVNQTQVLTSITGKEQTQFYTCSMHPQIRSTDPNGRCPICGMALVPVENEPAEQTQHPHITVSESAAVLADIITTPVTRAFPQLDVRLFGAVAFDESLLSDITAYFPGRVEKLYVNFTGIRVNKGDHLAEIYSPELITAQQELQQAAKNASQFPNSRTTLTAVKEKLRLWGLTASQIEQLQKQQTPAEHFTVFSPQSGIVIKKAVQEGQYLNIGTSLFQVAPVDRLWVKLEAYESQLPWLRFGQDVTFTIDANPGVKWHGRISFIDPVVNPVTRTAAVRVNVANLNSVLKPGMFVHATVTASIAGDSDVLANDLANKMICPMHPEIMKAHPGKCDICGMDLVSAKSLGYYEAGEQKAPLVIPLSAPLITGKRAIVYVRVPNEEKPTFEGRKVTLGQRTNEYYIVLDGLKEGDEVVTRGNFKLDSAMQIGNLPSMMNAEPTQQRHTDHQH